MIILYQTYCRYKALSHGMGYQAITTEEVEMLQETFHGWHLSCRMGHPAKNYLAKSHEVVWQINQFFYLQQIDCSATVC